jgi:hypothetical protein
MFFDNFIWNGRDTLAALLRLNFVLRGTGFGGEQRFDGLFGLGLTLASDLDGCLGVLW